MNATDPDELTDDELLPAPREPALIPYLEPHAAEIE